VLARRKTDARLFGDFERENVLGVVRDARRVAMAPFGEDFKAVDGMPIA
jgi:hypothetical protein